MNIIEFYNCSYINEQNINLFSNMEFSLKKGDIVLVNGGNDNLDFYGAIKGHINLPSEKFYMEKNFLPFYIGMNYDYFKEFYVTDLLNISSRCSNIPLLKKEILSFQNILGIKNIKIKNLSDSYKTVFKILHGFVSGFRIFLLKDPFIYSKEENKIIQECLHKFSQYGLCIVLNPSYYSKDFFNTVINFDKTNRFTGFGRIEQNILKIQFKNKINIYSEKVNEVLILKDEQIEFEKIINKNNFKNIKEKNADMSDLLKILHVGGLKN